LNILNIERNAIPSGDRAIKCLTDLQEELVPHQEIYPIWLKVRYLLWYANKVRLRSLSRLGVPNLAGEEQQTGCLLDDHVLEGFVQQELGWRGLVDQRSLRDSTCRGSLLVHDDLGGVDD